MSVCVQSVGLGAANGVLVLSLTTICCPVLLLIKGLVHAAAWKSLLQGPWHITVCQILR